MWYAIAGAAFGVIGGMGMGGGIILIPVLTLLLGESQHSAQGLNLLAFLPMSVFALIAHIRQKRVNFKMALYLCISGALGAVAGALLVGIVDGELLRKLFGGFLILLGVIRAVGIARKIKSGAAAKAK